MQNKKQQPLWLTIVGTVFVLGVFLLKQWNVPTTYPNNENKRELIKIDRVIDGDTVQLVRGEKKYRARLLLIDTPESVKENTPVQPYGKEASQRLREIVKQAKEMSIAFEKGQETDQYDRLLVYLFADGQLVQQTLVEEGYARVGFYQGDEQYYKVLKEAQNRAKQEKLRIWSIDGYVTERGFKKE